MYPAATNFIVSKGTSTFSDVSLNNDIYDEPSESHIDSEPIPLRRSERTRHAPDYLATSEIQRTPTD